MKGDGLFSNLRKHPFFMVEARKSKIGIEPFKVFVRWLQCKVSERDTRRYFLYNLYGSGNQMM